MKLTYALIFISLIYVILHATNYEHYGDAYTPYELEDITVKDTSYGYPFYYSPINENCGPLSQRPFDERRQHRRQCPQSPQSQLSQLSQPQPEHFKAGQYLTCTPITTMVLYTSTNCKQCDSIMPEWNKFANHINSICKYRHMVTLKHIVDDPNVENTPTVMLYVGKDDLNQHPPKQYVYKYDMLHDMFEKFLIEHIGVYNDSEYDEKHYADCWKHKMHGKYYTICDKEHQRWNTY